MKKYTKPLIDVLELRIIENIALQPTGFDVMPITKYKLNDLQFAQQNENTSSIQGHYIPEQG